MNNRFCTRDHVKLQVTTFLSKIRMVMAHDPSTNLLSREEIDFLCIGNKIDFRKDSGKWMQCTVLMNDGNEIELSVDGKLKDSIIRVNIDDSMQLGRFSLFRSLSKATKQNRNLSLGQRVLFNPPLSISPIHQIKWRQGKILKIHQKYDQILCQSTQCWISSKDANEFNNDAVIEAMEESETKENETTDGMIQIDENDNGDSDGTEKYYFASDDAVTNENDEVDDNGWITPLPLSADEENENEMKDVPEPPAYVQSNSKFGPSGTRNCNMNRASNQRMHKMRNKKKKRAKKARLAPSADKERPYKCEFCPWAFTKQCYLRNHRSIHTGEKRYRCPHCKEPFRTWGDANKHIAKIHGYDKKDIATKPEPIKKKK